METPEKPVPGPRGKTREARSAGQNEREKKSINEKMKLFSPYKSRGWVFIVNVFGAKTSKEELVSIGRVCAHELGLELTREYKRRKVTMILWFEENLDHLAPFIKCYMKLERRDDVAEVAPHAMGTDVPECE